MKKIIFLMALVCLFFSNNAKSQTVPLRVINSTPSTIWVVGVFVDTYPACSSLVPGTFPTTAIPPGGFFDFAPWMGASHDWASISVLGYSGTSNLAAIHPYATPCYGPSTSGTPVMTDTWGPAPSGPPFQTVVIN